jgi:glycosyltransferase involved in cell wall biosynthesis
MVSGKPRHKAMDTTPDRQTPPGMKIHLVNDDADGWVLGKITRSLRRELQAAGMDVTIGTDADPSAEINHHIIYYGYRSRTPTIETVMVTHIDDERELDRIKRQLLVDGVEMGICMSFEAVHRLAHFGVPREKLCFVTPVHDGTMRPRRILVGLATRLYDDGRKREHLLEELAGSISPDDFTFAIMGAGWELIVQRLRSRSFEVEYFDDFDETIYRELMPRLDYYLYLGQDEGSIGFIDALAAGVATIVTPQGIHLDVPGGITHEFETLDDLRAVFTEIAGQRNRRATSVASLTWSAYARKHLLVWEYLLCRKRRQRVPSDLMASLEGLAVVPDVSVPGEVDAGDRMRVFFGFEAAAFEDDRTRGGEANVRKLQEYFTNAAENFSVIYVNGSSLPPAWPRLFWDARQTGAALVWNQDGVGYEGWYGPGWENHNLPLALGNELADHVFYQSRFSKRCADQFLGTREGPSEILYNAVDTQHFAPGPRRDRREIVLLLGGNQHQFYRIESAVRTLAWLRTSKQNVRLVVTGGLSFTADPAEARRRLAALLAASGVVEFVDWIGPYRQADAPAVYAQADLLLHTKVKDPCPSVVIEALACGLPVVYADSGGVPELVGGDAGVAVKVPAEDGWARDVPPSAEAFGAAVLEALATRERLGEAARMRAVDHFDIRPWIQRHREVFDALSGRVGDRPGPVRRGQQELRLVRLLPERAVPGQPFNVQANGQSALVVECANACRATFIVFDGIPLRTDYGGPTLLSALVPPSSIHTGRLVVYLVTGTQESNRLEFVVEHGGTH